MQYKIGAYIRVSTEEQAQVVEGSVESQKYRIKAFVDSKAEHSPRWGKIAEHYVDDGFSAKDTKRPAYQNMMADIRSGKIDMILVTDISRLSRNIRDFCQLVEDLRIYKSGFLSIKEQFDTSTAAGEMMLFNMINLAQFERKQTSERVSMNFNARALRGLFNGGGKIYGLDPDPVSKGKLIVNSVEAEVVNRIFKLYLEHMAVGKVAGILNENNVPTKIHSFKNERHKREGLWTLASVYNILKNPIYVGVREINKANKNEDQENLKHWKKYQWVENSLPAIIDRDTFNLAQKYLEQGLLKERHRFAGAEKRVFLMSGILRCAECERALIGQAAHGRSSTHRYYGHKMVTGEVITCSVKRIRADLVEQTILNHLDKIVQDSGYLDNIESNIKKAIKGSHVDVEGQRANLQKQLDQIEVEIESIFKLQMSVASGTAASNLVVEKLETLANRKKEVVKAKGLLEAETQRNIDAKKSRQFVETNLQTFKRGFKKVSMMKQRKLLGELMDRVFLTMQGLTMYYFTDENRVPLTLNFDKIMASEEHSEAQSFPSLKEFFDSLILPVQALGVGSPRFVIGGGGGS